MKGNDLFSVVMVGVTQNGGEETWTWTYFALGQEIFGIRVMVADCKTAKATCILVGI